MDAEQILRLRMRNQFLTEPCPDVVILASELLGLHSWFYRNVHYSAVLRGADVSQWKSRLTKTWLYRGTLHGVDPDDLPLLLALHPDGESYLAEHYGAAFLEDVADQVMRCLEDGVYSRKELREIFAESYDAATVEGLFSPWGGIFVWFARRGKVAFRDMTSRDFDLIDVGELPSFDVAFPQFLSRFFAAYGPATIADAAWFSGIDAAHFKNADLSEFRSFELNGKTLYYTDEPSDLPDIPRVQVLSGFDPLIVSYADRSAILPPEYRKLLILSSGICMPSVAVDGKIAGLWSIKRRKPEVEFFAAQPQAVRNAACEQIERVIRAPEN